MRLEMPGFKDLMRDIEGDIAKAATEAMRDTTYKAVRELRQQVVGAGMSQRLANTWRDRVYPERRRSMTPTGLIWSNAPSIIDAFDRGATILPVAGSKYLAIPTSNVPRAGGRRGSTRRMTPSEVEHAFNADLFYKRGKDGKVLAFLNVVRGNSRSEGPGRARRRAGFRRGTAGRLKQGRALEPILMFVLVRSVRMPRLLDIDGVAERWANNFDAEVGRRLEA